MTRERIANCLPAEKESPVTEEQWRDGHEVRQGVVVRTDP